MLIEFYCESSTKWINHSLFMDTRFTEIFMIGKLIDIDGDSVVLQKIENVVVGCVIAFISRSTMNQNLV